ncbi:MAG TPA: polysaccharide deacetylase family protein [Limnochordia bacterium]
MHPFSGWPGGARAAVSLTFDDAAPSQLAHAIPILERYGLRGTFYVNPGPRSRFEQALEQWRAARRRGHEIANHTIRHPCSGNFSFIGEERALERWSLADIEADVLAASERLREVLPEAGRFSFAYPCGQTYVGWGKERQSYVPVIAAHFTAARGVGESANDPAFCDLHCLSSWMVQRVSAAEMIAMLTPAIAAGHWAIFCFHGVGGDHIPVAADAFEGLVRHLAEADGVWTDTVQTIGEYLAGIRAEQGGAPARDR